MTYTDLTNELEDLLQEIEHNPDLPLDALTQKVQRAYALIGEGRQQLRATEAIVTRVIEDFGQEEATAADEEMAEDEDEMDEVSL